MRIFSDFCEGVHPHLRLFDGAGQKSGAGPSLRLIAGLLAVVMSLGLWTAAYTVLTFIF